MFSTLLIANRGEIALRIARTCRELGIRTVAVYSNADADTEVLRVADEAIRIGPAAPRRSYLDMSAILSAALQCGAEAIHPGYGFLSEDPDFAEACRAHGVVLVGPPPEVMQRLGDKASARAVMAGAGLPVVPGSTGTVETLADAREVARQIGFPLMIKAAAGGGGMGMTAVCNPADFLTSYQQVRAHAQALFGDGRVYLERLVSPARHVEVQVVCDTVGNAVHLGERECSVQRRQQKLLEETPAPGLPREVAAQLAEAAVRGARAVGYVGAGTFEFLVDRDGRFYFMEVNCRVQVEHPVTEMVTGIDIVREQVVVAAGYPLSLRQAEIAPSGSAIECRINTEDPERGFVPTPGQIVDFRPPGGPFVRVDTHGYAGFRIVPDYDSLLAKVVVWAPDRPGAVARMDRALRELRVAGPGVATTAGFLRQVLAEPAFRAGTYTTSLVDEMTTARAAGFAEQGF
ncbi:acetyl-CoA carboxylase biotin carboxylase subunit [Natronosporangium hydrolyticum]|uniref:biotin carboxylase n=1 Tax=Natronosporangium hydrolyticum TaxID=2811111 RepID=A0A895YM03_9ACTN|nr:acetyl-CoA carboxylase biotin carboxylase subunit [Natronosporangium hydrolyticum]QSB16343.1 acetyl-CoA carboxylase biotin carboxylase subunit [Natronosporangium hydrolyticum]